MRISEFCGLTLKDIDLQNRVINIDHQLQRTSKMEYVIQTTKTNAGKRQIPITEEVARCFQAIIEDREKPRREPFVDALSIAILFIPIQYTAKSLHAYMTKRRN